MPGKHVEGGGELVGSNHPTWVSYAERFKLSFLDVTEEEDFDFPMRLGGKVIESEEAGRIWEELDEAVNQMNADAAKIADPHQPWLAPNAKALDEKTLASCCRESIFNPPRVVDINGVDATLASISPYDRILLVPGNPGFVVSGSTDSLMIEAARGVRSMTRQELTDLAEAHHPGAESTPFSTTSTSS